ncbi:MAG: hypothetical protein HY423_05940 [Candidatus Lambdaproteobacteria bacterium]|nr:hypothetical protein [Candidatus Lambdaproteobacteria bacterium]
MIPVRNVLERLKWPSAAGLRSVTPDFLRQFLSRNLSLKLFALGLAILMWGFVASQKRGEPTELIFTAPLVLKNKPASLEVTSEPVQAVTVLVQLSRALANSVNPGQFQVAVDLGNQLPGRFEYSLGQRNVTYNNGALPGGVSVKQINPPVIDLALEEAVKATVPIRPRFAGDLARGFTIGSITIVPPQAEVLGPASHIRALKFVPTKPLDVQDLQTDVEMLVTLDLPPFIRLAQPDKAFFLARIDVSNNPTRIVLRDIPVIFENELYTYRTSTRRLTVHLEGTREGLAALKKENVFAVVDLAKFPPGDYRGLSPKVVLPETVKVVEQWPILDLFVLKRKIKE